MAENKLLGKLQLDSSGVMKTIQDVNNALKDLGKGVDLNLTNILNTKVNTQLQQLKQQIEAVSKATTGMGTSQRDQINQAVSLMKQQIDLENKMMKQGVSGAYSERMHDLQKQYSDLTKNFTKEMNDAVQNDSRVKNAWTEWENTAERVSKKYSAISEQTTKQAMDAAQKETQFKLEQAEKVAKADEKIAAQKQKQFDKEYAQLEKEEQQKLALEQKTVERQRELEAKSYEAWWKQALDKRDMEKKLANETAQSQIQSATKLLKEQADIEKKLASGTTGPNETNLLNQQLAAKKKAFSEYGQSIQDAAKADASVVEAQQGVALAQAQAQDRALKEHQKAQEEAARAAEENARKMEEYQKKWATYAVSALGAASLSILKKQWTEAVNYAKSYYDALNEIRVVTGMTESQAMAMGQQMRDLAKEMKVTSTELSQAAITFYRQGLEPEEVQDRLKWVTEYAKIANMPFQDAAELMTAAINTMGDAIQESGVENVVEHVADVWLYLGDSAATSGEEIGKAMQKASASATEFGLSFEWLGTYIAVVAEQTRQAPEAIGNAFNSMLARMHQIKAKGFNDEDTTKLNDVAKALATINVELMESGQWRDMSDIYADIADKWGEMDAKQRGYIATTMAGTRQQNVFYALMNDMSKGLEGGSRAWELYAGAMNAAGTATEKYGVWQESIAASQANMKNSLEQLYSNLQPSLIKGFYDVIAALVGGLNNLGGVLPVVVSGVFGLATAIIAVKTGLVAANPLVAVMTAALGTLVSLGAMGIGGAFGGSLFETTAERYEAAAKQMADSEKRVASLQSASKDLATMFGEVQNGATLSKEELTKYSASLETISSISPTAEQAVRNLTSGFGDQVTILQELSDKVQETTDKELALQKINAETALINFQNTTEYTEAKSYSRDNYGWVKSGNYAAVASPSRYYNPLNYDNPLSNYLNGLIKTGTLDRTNLTEVKAAVDNFFANYEKTLSDAVNKEAANVVNNVISALGRPVNSVQRMQLGEVILDMLAGGDGNLDYEDVAKERVISIWGQLVKGAEEALGEGESELKYLIQKVWDDFGFAIDELDWAHPMLETDAMGNPYYEIEKVNTATAELIYSLLSAGKGVDEIQEAFAGTQNLDEFVAKLQELAKAEEDVGGASGNMDAGAVSISNFLNKVDRMNAAKAFNQIKTENIDESIKIIRSLIGVQGEGEDLGHYIKRAHEEYDKIFDSTRHGTMELDDFKAIAEKAQEAKEALDKLTGDKELSPKDQAKYSKILNEIFGDYHLAELEGTTGYITKATGLYNKLKAAVIDEASFHGDYGKSVIKYFSDLADELGDTELSGFIKKVEELQKVQDAFNLLTDDTQKKNATAAQTTSAVETLAKAFDDLDVNSPTYIEDVRAKIAELTGEVESGASAFGVLGQMIIDSMTRGADAVDKFKYAAADIADAVIGSGDHDAIGAYMEHVFGGGNVDLLNRKTTTNADGTWSTLQSEVVAQGNAVITITPMLPNGEVLSDEALSSYLDYLFASDNVLEADKIENGGMGLVLFSEKNVADIDAAVAKYQELALTLHELQAAYYSDSSLNSFAQQAADQIEAAKAATSGYKNELKSLSDAFKRSGPMAMAAEWAKLNSEVQNGIAKQFPSLLASINKVNKSLKDAREGRGTWADFSKAVTKLENEFEDIQSLNASKYFEGTADAILGLKNGTVDIDAALEKFNSEQKKAIEVQQEYEAAVEKAGTKAELTTADVSKMAEAFNMTPQQILSMWSEIGPMMEEFGADMEAMRASFQKEIFLSLVGTSTADFSAIQEGLMSVENMAQSTIDTLTATGQFEVIRKWMEENAEYQTFDPATGEIITTRAETSGWVDVIVPKGGSVPTKPSGSGSGGGGGGGGGNKTKETSAAMKALDRMSRIQKLQDHRRSLYSAQAGLYEQSGELQGVIAYNEKEIEVIEEQNETLEDNIKELEEWIAKKKEEMAALDQSSEEYTTAKDELEKLEDTHQEYTLALINNKKEVLSLRDAIKQLKNEIRDMQIEVYDEVVAALEARDAAEQERLEGAVAVQKSILEVMQEQEDLQNSMLQGRANVESAILETITTQKDKRQEERDAWLNFEQTVLGVIEEEKALRDSMNQGRIDAEQQVLETILATKELHDRMIDGRVDMENTVLEILKQQEEEVDSMREARISMENTIMEMMKAKEAEEEKLLQARVSLENTILNLIKAQASVQQKMLTATINLENRITSVLKAQDTRQKNLLQARINAENTVFGLIKERYETEKEAALEAASAAQEGNQAQIDALQKQKDLLDEQLQLRKKQAEEQDKAVELAELEAKYARISADPTRMKEALEIRKQIDDLRDEMAWETAQKEIDAQKQAIDDQINALQGGDGGSSAINAYYEELFNHPTKLLAEMDEILKGTDDEIIEWLKANSEEYTWASEANKKKMVEDWKDMLREMRGETEDYRDRVAEIMGLSDEEIIEWLKANDEEYLNASDNRRKQILESWNQTIREMRNEEISYNEEVARILGGSDEDILNWLAANDSSYANGTEAEQASKMKAWQKSLRELRGESENYLDEAHRIMTQSDDDIIAWLMENDKTYQEASDDRRQKIVEGWKETLDSMAGVTKDYRDVVNSILSGSADEIMAWLMNNDKAYALASDAEREQMAKGWQESLENMYGVTVNYWREIDLVLSGSEEQFVNYMKSHSLEYADASKTSREQMIEGWRQTYRDMKGEATNYWDEINELANGGYEGYIEELKKRSTSYATGSDEEKAQLLQEWTDVWEQMHGITKTYWDKVNEVIDGGLDNFLDFMKENNLDYAKASDAEKATSVIGWTDMWREMEGSSKDYRDEIAAVMAQGHDAYIGYMTSMSKEYADATEEEKQTMLKSYEDMWNQMTGKQKSYEDEANAIIAQGQEAIISTLTEYTEKYQNVGELQSQAYIDGWKDKLDKLKKALQEIAINTDVFDYTKPDEAGTTSGETSAASEEANKMYWRAEANWQRTFESRREALDYKNTKISELEAKLAASPKDENILSKLETWRNTPILYYARGGIADFTGPAWLDGSKRNPERILSPRQTELFDILVSSLEDLSVHVPSFPSFDWAREGSTDGGFSFGDIVINVAHLDSDTDYDDMAERVLDSVMQKINRGNVVGGIRFSK